MTKATYLGDGAYVSEDNGQLRIYASDGERVTNEVFLEPDAFGELLRFASSIDPAYRAQIREVAERLNRGNGNQ